MVLKVSLSSHGQTNHVWINLYYDKPSFSHFLLTPSLQKHSLHVHVATETTGAGVWFHTGQMARQLLAWPALKTAAAYHGWWTHKAAGAETIFMLGRYLYFKIRFTDVR